MANALDNLDIEYTYHEHTGSEGPTANGCYFMPVYHQHVSSCYCKGPSTYVVTHWIDNGKNTYPLYEFRCNSCGKSNSTRDALSSPINWCINSSVICGKTPGGTIESFTLGCGKDETTVESVTIIY